MQTDDWKMYKSISDSFTVSFPSTPKYRNDSGNDITAHTYFAYDAKNIRYEIFKIGYQPDCSLLDRPERSSLLILVRHLMGGEDANDKEEINFIEWCGKQVIKYEAVRKKGKRYIKGIITLSGSVGYFLMVHSSENNLDDDNFNRFIDSFSIT